MGTSRSKDSKFLVWLVLFTLILTVLTEESAEAARRRRGGGRRAAFGRRFNPSRGRNVARRQRNNNRRVASNRNNNIDRNRNRLGGVNLGNEEVDALSNLAIDPTGQRFGSNNGLILLDPNIARNIAVDSSGRAFVVDPANLNRDRELTVFQDQILGGNSQFSLSSDADLLAQAQRVNSIGVRRAVSLRRFR